MAFEFVPVQASEQEDLIRFLVSAFQADPALVSFRPDVMHWKYFSEHPEWHGPRSYVVKDKRQIVGHGGVWPVRLSTPTGTFSAIHLIDWAASRSAVGAGVFLLRKMAALADVLLTVGGSPDTQAVLPKLGYKNFGELRQYARVIRPWKHFETTPEKNWKTPVKWLRNTMRAMNRTAEVPKEWQASKVERFDREPESPAGTMPNVVSSLHTGAGLNHLLNCPAATVSAYTVSQSRRARGYFLIAKIGRQARIVDLRVRDANQESWNAVCALAAQTAASDSEICEVAAASSTQAGRDGWLQAGFTARRREQIFCYDPRKVLPQGLPIDLSLVDGDQCFMSDPLSPYLL
jgi:hypothetical protein